MSDINNDTVGATPRVMLEYSNDGGYTYLPNQIWSTNGRAGDRLYRCRWNKLGMSRDRVFKFTFTDPVAWRIIAGRLDAIAERV